MLPYKYNKVLDTIDAAIFAGDSFHDKDALRVLDFYLDKWTVESEKIKKYLNELDGTNG